MKSRIKISPYFYFILLFGFFHSGSNAQTLFNQHYLSDNIENLIYSNPDQALKIAQHLLSKTNTTNQEKAKINFLISKAYKAKGDYSSALNFLFEEKNYADYLSEEDKINIEIGKIGLLRELALDKQSKIFLQKLENKSSAIADEKLKSYLKTSIAIEKAEFLLKENQLDKGIKLLQNHNLISEKALKENQELHLNYLLTLGQFYLEQKDLAQAKKQFDLAIAIVKKLDDANIYAKAEALYGLASIAFLKKDHSNVISISEQALVYAKKLNNIFLRKNIMRQENVSYLALHDIASYKATNAMFVDIQSDAEGQEQEAINTAYNVISDGYNDMYTDEKDDYITILYYVLGLFLVIILVCIFFWQKTLQRKKRLDEIISYIEITRSNLVGPFTEKKNEPKKHVILKETEEQILLKLKRFENSKRFINKDISLAVLAGQLDSNTKYLSEIINTHYNVNFNTYINKLRINYIIEKLKTDPNFINYKISYLAENCGFASHSSFATVFKSITGISPVKFIELLNDEKENNLLNDAS
jgi:AraC-like DNA-binding protein